MQNRSDSAKPDRRECPQYSISRPELKTTMMTRSISMDTMQLKTMKHFTLYFDSSEQCDALDRAWFGEMWFPVQRHNYHVQLSIRDDCVVDPADLDLEYGCEEPDLCFSRSQVRDPAYALLDSGATHVLLPGHMLPKGARSFEVTVFNWQFWDRPPQDPKMTSYLTHGAKAKMCETTPFVNSVGTQYVASRAQLEQACDSLRQQGSFMKTTIGLSNGDVCAPTTLTEPPSCTIAEALMVPSSAMWSAMVVHTRPFPQELLQNACPYHEGILSCKPHRPGRHQWRPLHQQVYDDIQE